VYLGHYHSLYGLSTGVKNDYIQLRHDLAFMFGKEKEITKQISRFDSAIATHMLHSKVKIILVQRKYSGRQFGKGLALCNAIFQKFA
jgi:hypothetical protein